MQLEALNPGRQWTLGQGCPFQRERVLGEGRRSEHASVAGGQALENTLGESLQCPTQTANGRTAHGARTRSHTLARRSLVPRALPGKAPPPALPGSAHAQAPPPSLPATGRAAGPAKGKPEELRDKAGECR